jgi:hypothetical protein
VDGIVNLDSRDESSRFGSLLLQMMQGLINVLGIGTLHREVQYLDSKN